MERKNFKRKCLTGAALLSTTLLLTSHALAQSTMFYGPSGAYEGNAYTSNNFTSYYGPSGQYLGNSSSIGNTTSYYGSSGAYEGSSYGPAIAAPYGE
jgi:hypothetical protein